MIIKKALPEIKYFFADWSGVWSDDRYPVYMAHMKLWKEYSKQQMSFEEWKKDIPSTFAEEMKRDGINDEYGVLFNKYTNYLKQVTEEGILPKAYPGALDTIKFLKNKSMKIVVISGHPRENLQAEAERYGFTAYVNRNRIFGNIHNKKDGLIAISKNMGVNPLFSLYIGDTVNDVESAKGAGMGAIVICHGYHRKELLEKTDFDVLVEDLFELRNGLFL